MWNTKISELKIFAGIPADVVEEILNNFESKIFSLGETIVEEWALSDGKGYIIRSGEVLVTKGWEEISRLSTGEIFGEIALLTEEQRIATVEAISEVETIVLSQEDILKMLNNDECNINKEIIRRIESNLED